MAGKTVVLDGDCQLIIPSAGELGVVTAIRKPYPTYTGETTVTPSDEAQVLHTELQTLINDITVEAVPGDYVGSDIPRRDSSDVAASGATVTAPAGYYEAEATKTIQSGTEGTPIATKGAVSNHAVSVTPSVTNTEGYINGGTKSGTAVTVSASELVSGTKEITENGSGIDVTNYASVDVAVPSSDPNLQSKTNINPTTSSQTIEADPGYDGLSSVQINAMPNGTEGTPTTAKGAVSNHSVSVTPSVTNTAGYISGGTKTGTPVTVTAAELESGAKAITANGNGQDVTGYAAVNVNVPNSYTASDEGKVVNNGALEAQTSATYTNNGTYDTTLKNSVTVDVSSQTPVINPLSVTANGTYSAPAGVDGYSPVTVNVSGGKEYPAHDDDLTYFYIDIPNNALLNVPLTLRRISGTVTVYWGDGSQSNVTGTSVQTLYHEYQEPGEYTIVIDATNGGVIYGGDTNTTSVFGTGSVSSATTNTSLLVKAVEIGRGGYVNTSISQYAFAYCNNLESVVIKHGITNINQRSFTACVALKKLSLPNTLTTVGGYAFGGASHLSELIWPDSITSIETPCLNINNAINIHLPSNATFTGSIATNCYFLEELTVPAGVTSIPAYGLTNNTSMRAYHFLATTPPTLVNTNAFGSNLPSDCVFYVPAGSLEAYKTASNWSTYADRMIGE